MSLDTRAHDAAQSLRAATAVDVEHGLRRLHRSHRRRSVGKVIAAVMVVALASGVVQLQRGQDRAVGPVSPMGEGWVLVGKGVGLADEWGRPLADRGIQGYPDIRSADSTTRRFLVSGYGEADLEPTSVMTPGRREPLTTIYCPLAGGHGYGCFGAMLGPGPDELTAISEDLEQILVLGPDAKVRRVVGSVPSGGLMSLSGWSHDGEVWAEIRRDHNRNSGWLTLVLRRPGSAEETTLYEYSEAAPPWYDPEEHRYADGPGAFNDWRAPRLVDLRWAPDSARLAFATMTTPDTEDDTQRHVQWRLFVADTATGEVEQIAELGRCDEPLDEEFPVCDASSPSLAWTPDGERLTVLKDGSLVTYDLSGTVLDSVSTTLQGPIVWLETE